MFPEVVSTIEVELRRLEEGLADVEATRTQKKTEIRKVKKMLRLASDDGHGLTVGPKRHETPVTKSA